MMICIVFMLDSVYVAVYGDSCTVSCDVLLCQRSSFRMGAASDTVLLCADGD